MGAVPGEGGFLEDHFSGHAAAYAAHRPSYPPELVDRLADLAPGRALAWDCGCGNGQLSVPLAERFARVIASDASATQLIRARRHPRVGYARFLAERPGLAPATGARGFDLVVAAQAAHWFDLEAWFEPVRRVTRRGALVALASYDRMRVDDRVDAVVERFYTGALAPYWPERRRHVEDRYASLPFPFQELPAPELELRERWSMQQLADYVETWSSARALERAAGRGPIESFRRELREAWGRAPESEVRWPLALRLGRR